MTAWEKARELSNRQALSTGMHTAVLIVVYEVYRSLLEVGAFREPRQASLRLVASGADR